MEQRLFIVDVEATGPTPLGGVMTEFGVVDFDSFDWFHGGLWDFEPHPDIPALPVVTDDVPSPSFKTSSIDRVNLPTTAEVLVSLVDWVADVADGDRPVFVSDNPGFDFMWMACAFDEAGIENPFGYSSRRIGDFAAGLERDWKRSSAWKRLRQTKHTHNPVDDAIGNAQALRALIRRSEQPKV